MNHERTYVLRGQPPLDALSLVRIPLAVVVLVGVTVALAVPGLRLLSALDIKNKVADQVVAFAAFSVGFFAAFRAAARIRSRARSLVVVSASEVRYATKRGEGRFPNEGVELVSAGAAAIVVRQGEAEHSLPIEGELVGGRDGTSFHRLGVHDGRVVVTRVRPWTSGPQTEILPFD